MCKATYFEHDQRLAFYANSEPILYEPRKSRKSRKFRRCESLTTSIDDNDLDSYRLIASLQETQLEIRDRGAEKWWAKKWKTWGLMALFFCPQFFCHCKCTTDISVDVKMQFNANAFQGDHNVVEHWIPDARTCNYSGQASGNNSEMLLPTPFSCIISAFSARVQKLIVGIAFRQ
jgi:hypothetical protein